MIKHKLIVIKLKNLYEDDPVDRLRGKNVVKALRKKNWNIEVFNNQKNIDLIIYLDDYNLYNRVIFEYIHAKYHIVDIQDNHINRKNAASTFIKTRQKVSKVERIRREIRQGITPFLVKVLLKKLWYRYYIYSIKKADYILCSSNALKEEYQSYNTNIAYVPDAIEDTLVIEQPKEVTQSKEVSLCWIGTENNIVYLQIIDQVVKHLQKKYAITFTIICSKNIFLDDKLKEMMNRVSFTYNFIEWQQETVAFELSKQDIAVAPLPNGVEKSTNKILTYMASKVAVVCSGAKDYHELYQANPSCFEFISDNEEKEWITVLEVLILNHKYRNEKAELGHALAQRFRVEEVILKYENIFHKLLEDRE